MNKIEDSKLSAAKKIHFAMIAGPSMFLIVCLTTLKDRVVHENETMAMTALVCSVVAIILSYLIPMRYLRTATSSNAATSNKPSSTFMKYQTYKLIQWYLLEMASLFNLVVYFQTKNSNSMYAGIALLVYLAYRFPSAEEMNRIIPKELEHKSKDVDFL